MAAEHAPAGNAGVWAASAERERGISERATSPFPTAGASSGRSVFSTQEGMSTGSWELKRVSLRHLFMI